MKRLLLPFALLFIHALYAQSIEERDNMLQSYDMDKVKATIEDLTRQEQQQQERINNFVVQNPSTLLDYFSNGTHFRLYDIIDNRPVYISTDNRTSAIATKTNTLLPGGSLGLNLEADGMYAGVWEIDYALKDHVEFLNSDGTSRLSFPDTTNPNPDTDLHPTHVVGTVGASGVSSSAKGMAPKSTLINYNNVNDEVETATAHANTGMLTSNHSYGVPVLGDDGTLNPPVWYMGAYGNDAHNWDLVAYNNPYYLCVRSAGNSGMSSYTGGFQNGYDKLTSAATAKNNLVVANADISVHPLTQAITSMAIALSSSQGPTDDGRIKPDITGRGTGVFSCSNESTTSYASLTGTSMASPGVAGSLLLIQEHYSNINSEFMRAATLKGLACHTALDDSNIIGPDPYFGYGLLDAKFAAETITADQANTAIIDELTLNNGDTFTVNLTVSNPAQLRATISWTDPAHNAINNQANSTTPALINDLDIRITDASQNVYYPWKLDMANLPNPIQGDNTVDNLERVDINAPAAGTYTLTINHKGTLDAPQDYSLIVTGIDSYTMKTDAVTLNSFDVFPNPATDQINVKTDFNTEINQISLYDLTGRKVLYLDTKGTQKNAYQLEVAHLNKGVYLLTIEAESGTFSKKVTIK